LGHKDRTSDVTFYATAMNSICSGSRPFQMTVNFDDTEVNTAVTDPVTAEQHTAPGGIIGFQLNWAQKACT
jgi:hypothetical protein